LSDLLAVSAYSTAANEWGRLAHQRIDFVLCDRDSMRPIGIILVEADAMHVGPHDPSEQVAQLCAKAGLPVVRLQRQPTYMMHQLSSMIEPLLTGNARRDDFSNGDRVQGAGRATTVVPTATANATSKGLKPKQVRKQPAYPGYGALRTIANKFS
jgi:hypothetical protein